LSTRPLSAGGRRTGPPDEPPGPTELVWLERTAWLLDDAIRVPIVNWRIGLDPLIGLIPGAGDTVAAIMAAVMLASAAKRGVPGVILARMGINIGVDYLIGLVPFVGDLGDFAFKSNRKNLELLRRHTAELRRPHWSDYLVVTGVFVALAGMFVGGIWLGAVILKAVWGFITTNP
jgi:hypothetical protein